MAVRELVIKRKLETLQFQCFEVVSGCRADRQSVLQRPSSTVFSCRYLLYDS